jgi:hypothetical protein
MKPVRLDGVSYVSALLRLDDTRWVVCGRLSEGCGFIAVYAPMLWEVAYLRSPRTRAFVGGASEPERGIALVVGAEGVAVRVEGDHTLVSVAEDGIDLTAGAMDVLDREWVASVGRLSVRDPARDTEWRSVWNESDWRTPFVSVMADAGMVVAMTVDGGIVEGRANWRGHRGRQA